MPSLSERFWSKVCQSDACWEWTRSTNHAGYGQISGQGTVLLAHRLSWELHFGKIPSGQCVLHKCDNRLCVRPDHLFLGTRPENTQDMMSKGRLNPWQKNKVTCKRGHPLSGTNLYVTPDNRRQCKACRPLRGSGSNPQI